MKVLLFDIVRTTIEEVWPSVEHSLGLMYLAAWADRCHGDRVDVRIWTLVNRASSLQEVEAEAHSILEEHRPEVVGLRCLSIGKDTLARVAQTVREWGPACVILAGGPHASDAPEQVLRETEVDCVAVGEGEVTFAEILAALLDGGSLAGIPGTVTRTGDEIAWGKPRPLLTDLDDLPRPAYSKIDLHRFDNRYLTFTSKIFRKHANVMTSRGCPYRCLYCHNILGKRFRKRSPDSVFEEILWLHDSLGITDFQIIDDSFNLDRRRAKAICDRVIDSGLELTFSFPNGLRCDILDDELLDKLAEMGTRFVSIAVETASPRLQRLIRKDLDLDRVFTVIERVTDLGIASRGFFMLGFPTETYEEARMTIDFARDSALCGATFFTVVYFPGTELYQLARSLGYFGDEEVEVRRDYVEVGEGPYEFDVATLTALKRSAIEEFAFDMRRIQRARDILPPYFTQREIDGFFMSYVVSSGMRVDEVRDQAAREALRRHFAVAARFSRQGAFYV